MPTNPRVEPKAQHRRISQPGPKPKLDGKIERIIGICERVAAEPDVWRQTLGLAPEELVIPIESLLLGLHRHNQERLKQGRTKKQEKALGRLLEGLSPEQRELLSEAIEETKEK